MRIRVVCASVSVLVLLGWGPAGAQQTTPGCTSDEHAQFDFWAGSWVVTDPTGATVGRSTVERVSEGCALLETWTDASGIEGRSLNFYDPASRTWHQVWMGANGLPLRLEGNPDGPGRMVLSGGPRDTPQGRVRDRITWTLRDVGTVEQLWESSSDDGATWQVVFRGIYARQE